MSQFFPEKGKFLFYFKVDLEKVFTAQRLRNTIAVSTLKHLIRLFPASKSVLINLVTLCIKILKGCLSPLPTSNAWKLISSK
jgi:hypothetical protein